MNDSKKELDNNKKRRDEFLLHWYDKLWESIDRKESGLWEFVVFYGAIAGLLLAAVQDKIPPEMAIFFSMLASFWGINVSINYSGWFYRNLLITIKIEREFLDVQNDLGKIIPKSYHQPEIKLIGGVAKIHIVAFSFVISGIIVYSCLVHKFPLLLLLLIIGSILTILNYSDINKSIKTYIQETSSEPQP